jgi:hypothetical protein
MRTETDLTPDEARAILESRGYDAYGGRRIYATYGPDSPYVGQVAAIKSTYQLDDVLGAGIGRLYLIESDGSVPIRRAR